MCHRLQVDVGVIDDGASFDDPRAVQRYVLRKHRNIYIYKHWFADILRTLQAEVL